ncbi:ribonuclease E/G, partial [bacterium]|nr:ribonuclease E/G [bacterium]
DRAASHQAPYLLLRRPPLVDWVARELLNDDVDRLLIDNEDEYRYLIKSLQRSAPNLVHKVHYYSDSTRPLFDFFGVEQGIEEALQRKVQLQSGGNLVIERTEALWVIDVNTAQNTRKDAILLTNMEACKEVCRQLRLRDMAGMIIVDFIDMESDEDKRRLLDCLGDELRKDRTRLDLVGMTELGLVQLTRKREGKDLDGMLRTECPLCHGYGKILSPKSAALSARREVLRRAPQHPRRKVIMSLSPEASSWFDEDKVIALEKLIQAEVKVIVDKYLWPDSFKVSFDDEGR